ncbi:DNA alkylation repair protein [Streptomyces albidochromogenes]|uniref:DNA alkylation repair protein n=1 Tax=Streptomyces albidochromogenes TaxID=329524 RepID=A0ABW6FMR5_9ACTN
MTPPTQPRLALAALDRALSGLGTPERAARDRDYLRSPLEHLGVPVPQLRAAVKNWHRALAGPPLDDIVAIAEAAWAREVYEYRWAAVEVLRFHADRLGPRHLELVERLARQARTWALVDTLAVHVTGPLRLRHPDASGPVLDRWITDDDLWVRRTTLLSLVAGIREGTPDLDRVDRYGRRTVTDTEFFIRKALGWVLRELASHRHGDFVRTWSAAHIEHMSTVTLREAVRRLPPDEAELLLALRAARG